MIDMMVTIAAIALFVGLAVFALPAALRQQRQTDVSRKAVLDVPKHRFDAYDEHPSPGRRRAGSASSGAAGSFHSFSGFDSGTVSSDCGTSGGDAGGCS
ncbi:hypothetical protein FFI94_031030 [Rhodococcus sp. KBS0724]|uniref:hypothetical protein n=1 Tax=Rhodococcus sp. KBS0724 TaxID=1179674 RepID=UPI00110D89B6|nr:hypothetical protein [Rhodococcus sp. KBS0724]TSD40222.1 hypothetical protein FFI94_031030 [Rhodococcus sp. KBS0724]